VHDTTGTAGTESSDTSVGTSRRIAVIGAGFGGLAAAIELKRAGFDDLMIFERGDDVGGVWRENTYPGAACDVPSPLYSFSFERNPRWPKRYAPQPDILEYLRRVADRYDVRRHIRFGTEVTSADFDDATGRWLINTSTGDVVEADVLIPAVGQLSRPALPRIPGRKTFAGPAFHSAQWDHSVDLRHKRVAVIGTGASAVQFVPGIQEQVSRLDLYQRTPPYVVPRWDTTFTAAHHALFSRVPAAQLAERGGWYSVTEFLAVALLYSKPLAHAVTALSRRHMKRQVPHPDLFARVWPDYPIGCKRILFSNDYLPALCRPNVSLVTDPIAEIIPTGVRTADGVDHPADAIVYGTGFAATEFLAPMKIRGSGGRDLAEQWREGASAYLGIAVPNFPNLFLMYGPNTNLGSGSIVSMQECQARYIRQAVRYSAALRAPIGVRSTVAAEFDNEVQSRLDGGVWTQCRNWYRNASGRVTTNWPGTVTEYRRRTARFRLSEYDVGVPTEASAHR
jgi:cation diffusion facilitator CzcD-associated flavoprotein CzcO